MKILFCSDGSNQAENAVRFGALIAAACRAETSILGITEKEGDEDPLLRSLRHAQDILKDQRLYAELITKAGRPLHEIVKRTRERDYDLVVIGAVRKTTRHPLWKSVDPLWMSKLAYKIIEYIEAPVLVVIGERPALKRILLCTSGAPHADQAVEFTAKIARRLDAVVDLFHVMPEPPAIYADMIRQEVDAGRILASRSRLGRTLRRQKEFLEKSKVFGKFLLRQGMVTPELQKELLITGYDLVVSGFSPATDRFRRYMLGEITREIVNSAELPVLVIRTGSRKITRRFGDLVAHLFRRSKKT